MKDAIFQLFDKVLNQPLLLVLKSLADLFSDQLGWAIIALTAIVYMLLLPLVIPSMKAMQKMRDLKPELDRLKSKHKDKMELQKSQLALYQKHGINPAAGCLPNIIRVIILISLSSVIRTAADKYPGLNIHFFWLNLTQPDKLFVLPIVAGLSQFLFALMLTPAIEHHPEKNPQKTEDVQDMTETMQQQSLFIMPFVSIVFASNLSSGLALYWVAGTILSIFQQYFVSGWGGLTIALQKLNSLVRSHTS